MATALDTFLLYDSGAGANVAEAGWRQSMRHLHGSASGVIRGFANEFAVTGDSTGMQVKVATGECWIRGNYGESTAIKTLAITAAHATLGRKDRVVLRNDFGNNRIELDILTGTAAGAADGSGATAPDPATTTAVWETNLAVVTVPAADTSIDAAQVTDDRTYTTANARYHNSVAQSVANNSTSVKVAFNTAVNRAGDVRFNSATNDFTLLRSGLWTISTNCIFVNNGTGVRYLWISKAGEENTRRLGQQTATPQSGADSALNCTATYRFALNDTVAAYLFQNSGAALNTNAANEGCNISLTWIGP